MFVVFEHNYIPSQDSKRHKAHEKLETETIKASVLRRKLANFPHKLREEVKGYLLYSYMYFFLHISH